MKLPRQTRDTITAEESHAFTLIELLVVIAIIGILAALVIPLAGIATVKMRIARVTGELNNYANAIENYKLETGEYPQDNGLLRNMNTSDTNAYKSNAAHNVLFYELTGAIFTNITGGQAGFKSLQNSDEVVPNDLTVVFNANGIRNSARAKNDIDYKGFSLKDSQYARLHKQPSYASKDLRIISVPVPGPYTLAGGNDGKKLINPWFYDASSTNRHNKTGFDLWAEINIGGKTEVIGNWKK